MMTSSMHILGIHYFAPPTAVVGARRLAHIYNALTVRGVEIDILTTESHILKPKENAYKVDVNIHSVKGLGLRERIAGSNNVQFNEKSKKSQLFTYLNRWRQSYPLLYWTDEGGAAYYNNALVYARQLITSKPITHLFTSYRPWVDHRIGAALKSEFPDLHWIADFRDLPVDIVRKDVVLPKYQTWIGKRTISLANEIWVVSEGQKAQLANWHPNIKVIYNGLDTPALSDAQCSKNQFIVNYTGSLYPNLQSVDLLKSVLSTDTEFATSLVKDLKLQYTGKDHTVWRAWLEQFPVNTNYSEQPPQSQDAVKKLQQSASTNLLLNWSTKNYYGVLTAKLYDYLAAKRPITALVNGPDDPELRRIIEDSGAGKVFHSKQEAELKYWLEVLYKQWKSETDCPWNTNASKLRHLNMDYQLKNRFFSND